MSKEKNIRVLEKHNGVISILEEGEQIEKEVVLGRRADELHITFNTAVGIFSPKYDILGKFENLGSLKFFKAETRHYSLKKTIFSPKYAVKTNNKDFKLTDKNFIEFSIDYKFLPDGERDALDRIYEISEGIVESIEIPEYRRSVDFKFREKVSFLTVIKVFKNFDYIVSILVDRNNKCSFITRAAGGWDTEEEKIKEFRELRTFDLITENKENVKGYYRDGDIIESPSYLYLLDESDLIEARQLAESTQLIKSNLANSKLSQKVIRDTFKKLLDGFFSNEDYRFCLHFLMLNYTLHKRHPLDKFKNSISTFESHCALIFLKTELSENFTLKEIFNKCKPKMEEEIEEIIGETWENFTNKIKNNRNFLSHPDTNKIDSINSEEIDYSESFWDITAYFFDILTVYYIMKKFGVDDVILNICKLKLKSLASSSKSVLKYTSDRNVYYKWQLNN